MKVKKFLAILDKLGYNDETELKMYVHTYDGDSFMLKIEEIEDTDRRFGFTNSIDVNLSDPPKEYFSYHCDTEMSEMIDEIRQVIDKYR